MSSKRMIFIGLLAGIVVTLSGSTGMGYAATGNSGAGVEAGRLMSGRRVIYCPSTDKAPHIDGDLNDECWDRAGLAEGFLEYTGKGFVSNITRARVMAGTRALYAAFECYESRMDSLVARHRETGPNVWQDDCIELFLDTTRSRRELSHFVVNPLGTTQDSLGGNRSWRAAARRLADRWQVEMEIPYVDLGVSRPEPGGIWGINFARSSRPSEETSSWAFTSFNFWTPRLFGDIVFLRPDVRVERISLPPDHPGAVEVQIDLRNESGKPVTVETISSVGSGKEEARRRTDSFSLKEAGCRSLTVPLVVPSGRSLLELDIRVDGLTIYRMRENLKLAGGRLQSAAWPQEFHDDQLWLVQGLVQNVCFAFGNSGAAAAERFDLVLETPPGLTILDPLLRRPDGSARFTARAVKVEAVKNNGREFRRHTFSMAQKLSPQDISKVGNYGLFMLMFKAEEPLSTGAEVRYYLQSGQEKESPNTLAVHLLPRPKIAGPTAYEIGVFTWAPTQVLSPEERRALLRTYRELGINVIMPGGANGDLYREAHDLGYRRVINALWWHWWNDDYLKTDPKAAAIDDSGKAAKVGGLPAVCPSLLASDDRALRQVADRIRRELGPPAPTTDAFWYDLEGPSVFEVCFCSRCLDNFRRFAGLAPGVPLDAETVKGRYRAQWIDFAVRQEAAIMRRLLQEAKSVRPGTEILLYAGPPGENTRTTGRCDWRLLAPSIGTTAISWYYMIPEHLGYFRHGIEEFKAFIRKENPDIKLGAFLRTGSLRSVEGLYYRDPQLLENIVLAAAAFGFSDGLYLWFGEAMDGRAYAALAAASGKIGCYEAFFRRGRRRHDAIRIRSDSEAVIQAVIELDGRRLLILFNNDPSAAHRVTAAGRNFDLPPLSNRLLLLEGSAGKGR